MQLAKKLLSMRDLRRYGVFEIYSEGAIVAFAQSREPTAEEQRTARVAGNPAFPLEDLMAAEIKFLRQLWLARRPGILPVGVVREFAFIVAKTAVEALAAAGEMRDIRIEAGLGALRRHLDGDIHVRALDTFRSECAQAVDDHHRYATPRAATGCHLVHAALNEDAYEACGDVGFAYLDLYPGQTSETWLRNTLLQLIRAA